MLMVVYAVIFACFLLMLLGIFVNTVMNSRPRRQKSPHGPAAIQEAIDGYERTYRFNSAPIGLPPNVWRMSPYSALRGWLERRRRRRHGDTESSHHES